MYRSQSTYLAGLSSCCATYRSHNRKIGFVVGGVGSVSGPHAIAVSHDRRMPSVRYPLAGIRWLVSFCDVRGRLTGSLLIAIVHLVPHAVPHVAAIAVMNLSALGSRFLRLPSPVPR